MFASLVLAGCSSPAGITGLNPEASDAAGRLDALVSLDERVARVSGRLLEANASLCPQTRLSAGWALHAANQYRPALRARAADRFSLRGDLPGVLAAPPGSAASEAGVRQGDLIVAVDGATLEVGAEDGPPAWSGLEANIRMIDAALEGGRTRFDLERDGRPLTLTIEPRRACGYEVQLNPSDELNARADGRRLFISTALAEFAQSDDEIALILGHELAHHVLRHRSWDDAGGIGRSANPAATVSGGREDPEGQADRVGLYLLARAGYDPSVAAPFWRRFGASNWRVRYPQLGHASAATRARRLEAVAAEIAARQAEDEELRP